MINSRQIRQLVARTYNAISQKYVSSYPFSQYTQYVDRFLSKLKPNSRILDLGCGPGIVAKYITERGHKIVGIDISPAMLKMASKAAPSAKFRLESMQDVSFPKASFDGAVAIFSLLHVPSYELQPIVNKVRSFIKKDGYFLIAVVRGKGEHISPDPLIKGRSMFWRGFIRYEINEALMKAGFKILVIETNYSKNTFGIERQLWILCQAI